VELLKKSNYQVYLRLFPSSTGTVSKGNKNAYLFSCTAPAPSGRQIGEMLELKTTSVDSVMIAMSYCIVLLSKLGCLTKEVGVKLNKSRNRNFT